MALGILAAVTASAIAADPGAPPVPLGYNPGVLANGDFQASPWNQGWSVATNAPAGVEQAICGGDSCAKLWGRWRPRTCTSSRRARRT